MSSVLLTVPSVEFSIGTTPKSAWPACTSSNTSPIDGERQRAHRVAEVLEHRLLRERAFGTEERDLERLLLRQARRHDLAEQPHDLFVAQRPLVALERLAQHLRFALRLVEVGGARALRERFDSPTCCANRARSLSSSWMRRSMSSMRSRIESIARRVCGCGQSSLVGCGSALKRVAPGTTCVSPLLLHAALTTPHREHAFDLRAACRAPLRARCRRCRSACTRARRATC